MDYHGNLDAERDLGRGGWLITASDRFFQTSVIVGSPAQSMSQCVYTKTEKIQDSSIRKWSDVDREAVR